MAANEMESDMFLRSFEKAFEYRSTLLWLSHRDASMVANTLGAI